MTSQVELSCKVSPSGYASGVCVASLLTAQAIEDRSSAAKSKEDLFEMQDAASSISTSKCRSVFGQDIEPRITANGQADTLRDGSLPSP